MPNIFRLGFAISLAGMGICRAQIDPEPRRLVNIGYNQNFQGQGPVAAYGFYLYNQPAFYATNLTLRVALAPVYLDTELGISHLLGANTDVGVGVAGGGFADSYAEIRRGTYLKGESFDGHGGEVNASIYHLFNPGAKIPLNGIFRLAGHGTFYEEGSRTEENFILPRDSKYAHVRTGLRYGGKAPTMTDPLAMELSIWYEGIFTTDSGAYGFNNDRVTEAASHRFWGRSLLKYTFDESGHSFYAGLTAGASIRADRFTSYRLGGFLPFGSEFPLSIPGYFYQEVSAEKFGLLNAEYDFALGASARWNASFFGAVAAVDWLDQTGQGGTLQSGVGGGITYVSSSKSWFFTLLYGHGFNSIRGDNRGSDQVAAIVQYDFVAKRMGSPFEPAINPYRSKGAERLFR